MKRHPFVSLNVKDITSCYNRIKNIKPKREDLNMKRIMLLFLMAIMPVAQVTAAPVDSIPNTYLRVTVQQKEDEKIDKGFHILELSCWDGNCSLSSVSLNQCGESGSGKKSFYPKTQHSATWMGNLKVRKEGSSLIVQESGDQLGDYVVNLRFDYEPVGKDKIINRLIGFSGGFIKNSAITKEVLAIEYVPLTKAYQAMKLDCDVLLPGIDKK